MISARPGHRNFAHAVGLAEAAMAQGVRVYAYCIDEGVRGVGDPRLQNLKARGLNLYACAYSARRRNLPTDDRAAYAGLAAVAEILAATDRFVALNE